MIVIDTSVIVAIFHQERDAERYARMIATDGQPLISAANVVETSLVVRAVKKLNPGRAEQWLDQFLHVAGILIEPVTIEQAELARRAHVRFGKGTGHPARLNFGDCFAYALAKALNAPLLFKGGDFTHTDIIVAS